MLDSSICGGRGVVTRRRNGGSTRNRTVSLASKENEEKERKKPQFPSFEKQKAEQILSHTVLDRYVESSTSIICTRSRSLSFPLFPFFFSSVNLGSYLIPEFIPFFIIVACNSGHGLDATRLCYASLLLIAITYSKSELSFYILF